MGNRGEKFEIGDIVKLKSGGPEMTVNGYVIELSNTRDIVTCKWFDSDNKQQSEKFHQDALEIVPS